nr:MAG TPA: hypothetical protein [Caudoviricetes sp.]
MIIKCKNMKACLKLLRAIYVRGISKLLLVVQQLLIVK